MVAGAREAGARAGSGPSRPWSIVAGAREAAAWGVRAPSSSEEPELSSIVSSGGARDTGTRDAGVRDLVGSDIVVLCYVEKVLELVMMLNVYEEVYEVEEAERVEGRDYIEPFSAR